MKIVKISEKGEKIKQFEVKRTLKEEPIIPTVIDTKITNDIFYEIDYSSSPIPGVGQYKPKAEQISESNNSRDIITKFNEMRRIRPTATNSTYQARRVNIYSNYFYESNVNSHQFYEQAKFMEDFSDNYDGSPTLFRYFPVYQGMSDNQLRRYFSWRTKVREGLVENIDPSYAFIYIYELMVNIGVLDPFGGLDRLVSFWKDFRNYTSSLNRYIVKWIKDYYIFYNIPYSFRDLVKKYELTEEYPEVMKRVTDYDQYMNLSSYDISRSKFYTEENIDFIEGSFCKLIDNLRAYFSTKGKELFNVMFEFEIKNEWEPFKEAVFYKYYMNIGNIKVDFSKTEQYVCRNNEWVMITKNPSSSSKHFMSFLVKRLECELRRIANHKNRLTADLSEQAEIFLRRNKIDIKEIDSLIIKSIDEYYREKNKVVIEVDDSTLNRIRSEAIETQERLTVEEISEIEEIDEVETSSSSPTDKEEIIITDEGFLPLEIEALRLLLNMNGDIKLLADTNGVMLEVLVDGINEKAIDKYGDNLISEEYTIYEEYIELVKEIVG